MYIVNPFGQDYRQMFLLFLSRSTATWPEAKHKNESIIFLLNAPARNPQSEQSTSETEGKSWDPVSWERERKTHREKERETKRIASWPQIIIALAVETHHSSNDIMREGIREQRKPEASPWSPTSQGNQVTKSFSTFRHKRFRNLIAFPASSGSSYFHLS